MLKKIFSALFLVCFLMLTGCNGNTQPLPKLTPQQNTVLFNARGNTILGNPNAPVTVVEIFDYNCDYCRKMVPVIQKLVTTDPNVRVIFKEVVLIGPNSEPPTRAALAAQKQGKYLPMRNALMTSSAPLDTKQIMNIAQSLKLDVKKLQQDMDSAAITQQLQENGNLVNQLNIQSIPVLIISKSTATQNPADPGKQFMVTGQVTVDQLEKLIAKVKE